MAMFKSINLLKKHAFPFIFFILVSFFLQACSNENTSEGEIYFKDGTIYSCDTDEPFTGKVIDTISSRILEYDVVNGIKNGEFIIYFTNHQPEICGRIKDNKNEGKWSYYYSNGKLESQGNFKNDFPSEKWVWYYPDGTIKEVGYFINGKKEGKWVLYDKKGKLTGTFMFRDGEIVNQVESEKSQAV